MIRLLASVVAFLLLLHAASVRAQDYVVVESSLATLATGTTLSAGATLDIPAHGRVVLVTSGGLVVALQGPFQGTPPAVGSGAARTAQGDMVNVLAALASKAEPRR